MSAMKDALLTHAEQLAKDAAWLQWFAPRMLAAEMTAIDVAALHDVIESLTEALAFIRLTTEPGIVRP